MAIHHACERVRRIKPRTRDGKREKQRWKAHGEVRNARVPLCQNAHRSLESWKISSELTFKQIGARGLPARGQQEIRRHDENSASAGR
jgi:hypothetical protein